MQSNKVYIRSELLTNLGASKVNNNISVAHTLPTNS